MLWIEPGLYVRIEQLQGPRAPMPHPLENGFNTHTAYRLLGLSNPSETADAYAILSNDADQMWFICTRHLRILGPLPANTAMRVALADVGVSPAATAAMAGGTVHAVQTG